PGTCRRQHRKKWTRRERRSSLNRRPPTWSTCPNTIHGWYMGTRWLLSPVGIRIRGSIWMARESASGWDSEPACLAASAGVGPIGDTIGAVAEESSTTTTPTFPTAERLSTAMLFAEVDR